MRKHMHRCTRPGGFALPHFSSALSHLTYSFPSSRFSHRPMALRRHFTATYYISVFGAIDLGPPTLEDSTCPKHPRENLVRKKIKSILLTIRDRLTSRRMSMNPQISELTPMYGVSLV
ncbi:hypothetical protein M405DRAFT_102711 [Rhizopogon salebrosus TDB-379]|nr:hypothetical protein M405DRAFT_102711 [Rhizopogon salebrosus TDB-379]